MTAFEGKRGVRYAVVVGLLVGLAAAFGCTVENPQLTNAQLRGTVRLKDGQPLPGAEIRLIGVDDPSLHQAGFVRADGRFEVLNAPIGDLKVLIDTHSIKGHPALMPGGDPAKAKEAYGGQLKFVPIHKKYNDPAQTPLRVTINKGDNEIDFEVE